MRYEVKTSLTPEEVVEQAVIYFGPGGAGLDVTSQTAQGVILQGGGGYVAIQAQAEADTTTVDIETREWDYPAQQFMARISRRRHWWSNWFRRRSKKRAPEAGQTPQPPIFTILNNHETNRNGDHP